MRFKKKRKREDMDSNDDGNGVLHVEENLYAFCGLFSSFLLRNPIRKFYNHLEVLKYNVSKQLAETK